jgi:hypothetical protein
MSEISYTPPPPPPPTVPPSTPTPQTGFDFGKAFSFIFEDPRWVQKTLLGGLFYLAGFLIIGWFFILGYCAKLARNVMNGVERPLPEWDELGDYFAEGLRLFGIVFLYILPIIAVALLVGIPAAMIGALQHNEGAQMAGSCLSASMVCLMFPLGLAVTFWYPAAMLRAVAENRFGAAFEFGPIWRFIKANIGNYLLAILVFFIARFAAGIGIILFCIGIIFTGFLSMCVMTHAFAQVWRYREQA